MISRQNLNFAQDEDQSVMKSYGKKLQAQTLKVCLIYTLYYN